MSDPIEQILSAAWTRGASNRDQSIPFPRGFWPDVARAAVYLALGLPIDFRQTQCTIGNSPAPTKSPSKKSTGKISADQRAANTAALLAAIRGAEQ